MFRAPFDIGWKSKCLKRIDAMRLQHQTHAQSTAYAGASAVAAHFFSILYCMYIENLCKLYSISVQCRERILFLDGTFIWFHPICFRLASSCFYLSIGEMSLRVKQFEWSEMGWHSTHWMAKNSYLLQSGVWKNTFLLFEWSEYGHHMEYSKPIHFQIWI